MPGPDPAVAAARLGVRRALAPHRARRVVVACSGGADSTALAAAVAFEAPKLDVDPVVVIVDHGLQDDSAQVAAQAADRLRRLGLDTRIERVAVGAHGGVEAAAREARYARLRAVAARIGAVAILLGHTRDDQAETVLLGLVRGSGTRSLAGMAPVAGDLVRPLLEVTRAQTRAACAAEGHEFWDDPHNDDPRFLRVRVRRALAHLETDLGPGLVVGLARTADLARQDADHLDAEAGAARTRLGSAPWPVDTLVDLPVAVRTRWWRRALADAGVTVADLSSTHVRWLEALLTDWTGQGPVDVPGGLRVGRADGLVHVRRSRRVE